jgi:serine/threonine-protein kinase
MVNSLGKLKIMDFGLARLADRASVTQTATILGTPAYMSPEQAQGLPVDRRSDLWSLGAVLYEMVTGRLPFVADHEAAVLHGILYQEHEPITAVRAGVPLDLDRIIDKALAKRTDERYQHADDFLIDVRQLRGRLEQRGPRRASVAAPARPASSIRRERIAWMLVVTALLLLCGWLYLGDSTGVTSVTRVLLNITPAERLRAQPGDDGLPQGRPSRTSIALSPDGRSVVFSAVRGDQQQLFVRALDALEAVPISGTEGALCPFFSPDGQWIAFWAAGALRKVPVAGGPPVTVADVPIPIMSASWGAGDAIVFAGAGGNVWRVSARGGKPDQLTTLDTSRREHSHRFPQLLPGGQAVLFTVTHDSIPNWDRTEIVAQRLATGERARLIEGGADGRYLSSRHLLYVRHGNLMAAPFDASRLQVTGGSIGMVAGVMQAANMGYSGFDSGAGQFSVSENGSLAYVAGGPMRDREFTLVWVDRGSGKVAPLQAPLRYYLGPRLSPDGTRVAVAIFSGDIAKRNVWIHDIGRGTLTPLTTVGDSGMPVWTPDGARVVFPSGGAFSGNLFWISADGTGKPERLTTSQFSELPSSISRADNTLLFTRGHDLWMMGLDGKRAPKAMYESPLLEGFPDVSPDGRWLAYTSTESGRPEVWVQPFPGPGPRQQVSRDGGQSPAWRNDGRELFYHSPHTAPPPENEPLRMMAVPVTASSAGVTFGPAVKVFEGHYFPTWPIRGYDVTRDGQRFLMVQMDRKRPLTAVREIVLVQNWTHELRKRVRGR